MNTNILIETDTLLLTPLYRTILDPIEPGDIVPYPEYNYNKYNLLSFKTKLRVLIVKKWGSGIEITLPSTKYNDRMYVKVVLKRGGKPLKLSTSDMREIKKLIAIVMSEPLDKVVIISKNDFTYKNTNIPGFWISKILPYIIYTLNNQLDDYKDWDVSLTEYGIESKVHLHPNPNILDYNNVLNSDWMERYIYLQEIVTDVIYEYYRLGYIVDPSKNLIKNWRLIKIIDSFYSPDWYDARIYRNYGGMTPFFWTRELGDDEIKIYVGDKYVHLHRIAKIYPNSHFSNDYLHAKAKDINQSLEIINLVNSIPRDQGVAYRFIIQKEDMAAYVQANKNLKYDFVIYTIDSGNGISTVLSIEFNLDESPLIPTHIQKLRTEAVKILNNYTDITN